MKKEVCMKRQQRLIFIAILCCCVMGVHASDSDQKTSGFFNVAPTQDQMRIIPNNLLELYKNNPSCEFLNRLIQNYDLFLEIYKKCNNQFLKGCGSYLFDGSTYTY